MLSAMLATAAPAWVAGGSMQTPRWLHTATLLPNGKVLVAGGDNGNGGSLASAELYDPATNSWSMAGELSTARYGHTATLLPNGKVLVSGGGTRVGGNNRYLASAELYDPTSNSWVAASVMASARGLHTATLLANGKVLVAGGITANGRSLVSAELYDPATNSWSAAGTLVAARANHTATLLPNGKLLVAGGTYILDELTSVDLFGELASAELYDPVLNSWSVASALNTGRAYHTATQLPNGTVLVAGGYDGSLPTNAELYDPAANSWSAAGALNAARHGHTATLLWNGKVLITGGGNNSGYLTSAEQYDPSTNSWSAADRLFAARFYHTATLLQNGKVLVTGGASDIYFGITFASAELFDPMADSSFPCTSAASASAIPGASEPQANCNTVMEFYNTNLDHYFLTADAGEASAIDNGSAGPGWSRTGLSFKAGGTTPVCRFYGSQSPGPNSHFNTVMAEECATLKQLQASTPATQKRWNFESLDFLSTVPLPGAAGSQVNCPNDLTPVYRAYNNGFARGVDSNHRLSTSLNAIQQVEARGWINEGVVMCAPL